MRWNGGRGNEGAWAALPVTRVESKGVASAMVAGSTGEDSEEPAEGSGVVLRLSLRSAHPSRDVNGLKALNDQFGYEAGDILISRFAEVLVGVGLDAYHDKGDEFLCKGKSFQELNENLSHAQLLLREQPFAVFSVDGRITTIPGADFCFGIGMNLQEAERSLKHQKELQRALTIVLGVG